MSLQTRLVALATAIGVDIKALFSRSLPTGGVAGQVLTKKSATNFDAAWRTPGGVGGTQQVFVQPTAPVVAPGTPYIWCQTGLGSDGEDMTIWLEDGL